MPDPPPAPIPHRWPHNLSREHITAEPVRSARGAAPPLAERAALGGSGSAPCQSSQLSHRSSSPALGKLFLETSQPPKRRAMGRNRLPFQQRAAGAGGGSEPQLRAGLAGHSGSPGPGEREGDRINAITASRGSSPPCGGNSLPSASRSLSQAQLCGRHSPQPGSVRAD